MSRHDDTGGSRVEPQDIIARVSNAAIYKRDRVARRSAAVVAIPEHAAALNSALGSASLYEHFEQMIPSTFDPATRHATASAAVALAQRSKISADEFAMLTYAVEPVL